MPLRPDEVGTVNQFQKLLMSLSCLSDLTAAMPPRALADSSPQPPSSAHRPRFAAPRSASDNSQERHPPDRRWRRKAAGLHDKASLREGSETGHSRRPVSAGASPPDDVPGRATAGWIGARLRANAPSGLARLRWPSRGRNSETSRPPLPLRPPAESSFCRAPQGPRNRNPSVWEGDPSGGPSPSFYRGARSCVVRTCRAGQGT